MRAPRDEAKDVDSSLAGTVDDRATSVVDVQSEVVSPGANADKEEAEDSGREDD